MLKARETVRTLKEYHPPLGEREGLRLDFNENTAGCSPRVMECLRNLGPETLANYPVREKAEAIVAAHLGISTDELLLTNGTDEAIHLVCETYLEPGDEAIVVVPAFAMAHKDLIVMFKSPPAIVPGLGLLFRTPPNFEA